jgi:hypothetical protein
MAQGEIYRDTVVRLSEIAGDEAIIQQASFQRCEIRGPAVAVLQGEGTFSRTKFQGSADAALWEIPPSRTSVLGAIIVEDCNFEDCQFVNVGFAGPPELMDEMRQQIVG